MSYLKKILFIVLLISFLELIKYLFDKISSATSVFHTNLISSIQLFLLLAVIFFGICTLFFRYVFKKNIRWVNSVIAMIVVLCITEAGVTYLLYHPYRIPANAFGVFSLYYEYYCCNRIEFFKRCSAYNTLLSYTLKPGSTCNFSNFEFNNKYSINKAGLRDEDSSLIKPSIICLGDSYTMGWGVNQNEAFPKVLERITGYRVLNAGISSYGTAREILRLKSLDYSNCKYLIIQYCANDERENEVYIENNYNLPIMSAQKYDSLARSLRWSIQYFPLKHTLTILKLFIDQAAKNFFNRETFENHQSEEDFNKNAEAFLKILQMSSLDFNKIKVIVIDTTDYIILEKRFIEALKHKLQLSKFQASFGDNIIPIQLSEKLSENDFFNLDQHINASGHNKIAEIVAEYIRAHE